MQLKVQRSSKLQIVKNGLLRLVLPFIAVRRTLDLVKNEVRRSKENLNYLKALSTETRQKIQRYKKDQSTRNDSFETTLKNRSSHALSKEELYQFFLGKKRTALVAALFFLLLNLISILKGIYLGEWTSLALGVVAMFAGQPLFFMLALGAQLRLWQLRTGRLSHEEKGGLQDYLREVEGWWWETVDPEINFNSFKAPR
jgi:hypothetical protein